MRDSLATIKHIYGSDDETDGRRKHIYDSDEETDGNRKHIYGSAEETDGSRNREYNENISGWQSYKQISEQGEEKDHSNMADYLTSNESGLQQSNDEQRERPSIGLRDFFMPLVLGRLPVRKLCQVRCVCKAWNEFLRKDFLLAMGEEFWMVLHDCGKVELSILSTQGYLQSLPSQLQWLARLVVEVGNMRLGQLFNNLFYHQMASGGGIICTQITDIKEQLHCTIIAIDALTGDTTPLPSLLYPDRVDMTREKTYLFIAPNKYEPLHFFLLRAHCLINSCDLHFYEVFSSITQKWTEGQPTHLEMDVGTNHAASFQRSFQEADFYLPGKITKDGVFMRAYSVAQNVWSCIHLSVGRIVHEFDRPLISPILHFQRRMYFGVGIVRPGQRRTSKSIRLNCQNKRSFGLQIWQLLVDRKEGKWTCVEVERTPEDMFQNMTHSGVMLQVGGEQQLIFIMSDDATAIIYDVAGFSWKVLRPPNKDQDFLPLTFYRPRLAMSLIKSNQGPLP